EAAARLPAAGQLPLLTAWIDDDLAHEERFRHALGRLLLRLALARRDRAILDRARRLLPPESLGGADVLFDTGPSAQDEAPAGAIWRSVTERDVKKLHQR